MDDSKVVSLCKDLATLDWSTALDQDEMYRTVRQKHDAGWNRAVWHRPNMKCALAKALNGEEVVEEECIEEEAGLDVDEAGNSVSRPFVEPMSSAGPGAVIEGYQEQSEVDGVFYRSGSDPIEYPEESKAAASLPGPICFTAGGAPLFDL